MQRTDIKDKLMRVDLIVSDVDGVLTDGTIQIHSDGTESKQFSVKDGAGAALIRLAGMSLSLLSARYSEATTIRSREMGVETCFQGRLDKRDAFIELCDIHHTKSENAVYVGDGLVDIPAMEASVCAFAPADSHPLVLNTADVVTVLKGGQGILREVAEIILTSQGRLDTVMKKMRQEIYRA